MRVLLTIIFGARLHRNIAGTTNLLINFTTKRTGPLLARPRLLAAMRSDPAAQLLARAGPFLVVEGLSVK